MIVVLNRVRKKIVHEPIWMFFPIVRNKSDHIDLKTSLSNFSTTT